MQNGFRSFYNRTLISVVLVSFLVLIFVGVIKFHHAMNLISKDLEVRFYTFEKGYINHVSNAIQKIKFLKNTVTERASFADGAVFNQKSLRTQDKQDKQSKYRQSSDILAFIITKIENYFVNNSDVNDSSNIIFLVDIEDKIIYSSRNDLIAIGKGNVPLDNFSKVSLSDRDYLSKNKQDPSEIHLGALIKGAITGNWVIPVSAAVTEYGKYIGSVIFTVPLSEFSKENIASDIKFGDIKILGTEEANQVSVFSGIKLQNAFSLFYKLFIERIENLSFCYELSSLEQKAYASISGKDLRSKILDSFLSDFLLLSIFIGFCIAIFILLGRLVFRPLEAIHERIKLIEPSFLELLPTKSGTFNKSFNSKNNDSEDIMNNSVIEVKNIKAFIDKSTDLINYAKTQKDIISNQNKQLASIEDLHRKFLSIFRATKESRLIFAEEIRDLIDSLEIDSAKELVFRSVAQLYDMNQKEIDKMKFLDESVEFAVNTISVEKQNIDILETSTEYFRTIDPTIVLKINENILKRRAHTRFYFGSAFLCALRYVHMAILDNDYYEKEDNDIRLEVSIDNCFTESDIRIEISKKLSTSTKDEHSRNLKIDDTSLYQAKIYALLNDGLVDVYFSNDEVRITLVLR
jgi:hypothetical protein